MTSKKSTAFKLVFIEMERLCCLKWSVVIFFNLSGPDTFFRRGSPSSPWNPMFSFLVFALKEARMSRPTT